MQKIRGYQQELSKKKRGCKNWLKTLDKLQEAYRKLWLALKCYAQEIALDIIKDYDIIIVEHLNIKSMLKKENNPKYVRQQIHNAVFAEILKILINKCMWKGKIFHSIATYYPSSQICSRCGHREYKMKDSRIRLYTCSVCGLEIERDYNASINILQEGLRELNMH